MIDLYHLRIISRIFRHVKVKKGCWLMGSGIERNGYARITYKWMGRKVHRVLYEILVSKIPKGLQLDHLCSVRNCINPNHLEPVTPRINTLRGNTLPGINSRKTHCKYGHKFSNCNTYIFKKSGYRRCRKCINNLARKYREESKCK